MVAVSWLVAQALTDFTPSAALTIVVNFEEILIAFDKASHSSVSPVRSGPADWPIAAGRAGWIAAGATAIWTQAEEIALLRYANDELTPDVLGVHGDGAGRWAGFSCYAVGWLIALRSKGLLSDTGLEIALAQLPGFMWLNEQRICNR